MTDAGVRRGRPAAHASREWAVSCAAGTLLAAGAAAMAAGLLVVTVGEAHTLREGGIVLAVMAVSGWIAGAAVGAIQTRALRRAGLAVPRRPWAAVTGAAASVAWLLALAPSTLSAPETWASPPPALGVAVALATGIGLAVGAGLGAAQWLVVHRRPRGARRWIAANAVGAAVAGAALAAASGARLDVSAAAQALFAAAAAAAGGLALGAITAASLPALAAPVEDMTPAP